MSYASPPVIVLTFDACGRDTLDKILLQGEEQDKGGNHRQRGHRQRAAPVANRACVADERAQGSRYAEDRRGCQVQKVIHKIIPRPQECK